MDFVLSDRIITQRRVLRSPAGPAAPLAAADAIHIAYGIDDRFVMPMGVAILSIVDNNRRERFVFHVLAEALSEESIASLKRLCDRRPITICIHYIDGAVFDRLPVTEHFTKATYNRFLLTKALRGQARRVIYLDADILCLGSLDGLKQIDFNGRVAAVAPDIGAVAERQIRKLNLQSNRYFNAGFLYIDIDAWERNAVSEQALKFSFDHLGKLNWLDQDALNVTLEHKTIFIDTKYNYIFDFGLRENSGVKALPPDTVFVHYAGRYKPWQEWCMHGLKRDFLRYFYQSPWRDAGLEAPRNYKEMKKMARSHWRAGRIGAGLRWYLKYAYHKMKS